MNSKSGYVRLFFICMLLVGTTSYIWGQTPGNSKNQTELQKKFRAVVDNITRLKKNMDPSPKLFDIQGQGTLDLTALTLGMGSKARAAFAAAVEEARMDKQVGGDASNAGSTTLVSKGSVPSIFGLAVENGALTKTESGTTITFRGNPVGIINALRNKGFFEAFEENNGTERFLRRISFALSFDTNRGNSSNSMSNGDMMNVFTGDKQQLASYSFRFDILNRRDPRDRAYTMEWAGVVKDAQNLAASIGALLPALLPGNSQDPAFGIWLDNTNTALNNASIEKVEETLKTQMEALVNLVEAGKLKPTTQDLLNPLAEAYGTVLLSRSEILETAAKGSILTFEYTNINRPNRVMMNGDQVTLIDVPDLSNFKLIYEQGVFNKKADLTANASFTLFNSLPTGRADRLRDFQIASQLDIPLSIQLQKTGNFVLSFSGMYKRRFLKAAMMEDDLLNIAMKDRSRDTAIGQIKLIIPIKGSGVKIPISVTFANRTELIKEKEVRGNIGITFDLDTLFWKFKN